VQLDRAGSPTTPLLSGVVVLSRSNVGGIGPNPNEIYVPNDNGGVDTIAPGQGPTNVGGATVSGALTQQAPNNITAGDETITARIYTQRPAAPAVTIVDANTISIDFGSAVDWPGAGTYQLSIRR